MTVRLTSTPLPEVKLVEPAVYSDDRGYFMETWHAEKFAALGLEMPFVQDNQSHSVQRTLRGLHYQVRRPQGKLVRCSVGSVYDVAVDIRRSSPTFGQWFGVILSEENGRQLWVPPGFAHGFLALSEGAQLHYKCTQTFVAPYDRAIRFDDPALGIEWPLGGRDPLLSTKDRSAPFLGEAELFQ